MSLYYFFLNMRDKGIAALETAVKAAPDNYWYARHLVERYQEAGDKEKTLALLEDMSTRFPDRRELLFMLADMYGAMDRNEDKVKTIDKLETLLGRNEQLTMEKVNAYLQMGKNDKAFDEAEKLAGEYPQDNRYKVILGDLYLHNGEDAKAYEVYQEVLRAEPDNSTALVSLAGYYEKTGQTELFEEQVDRILSSATVAPETKLATLYARIGSIEKNKQESSKAVELFEKTLGSGNYDAQILLLYAQYLWEKNQQDASFPVLEELLRMEPDNKQARLMALQTAVRKEDYKKVKDICEPGIEYLPELMEMYIYLAIAYNQEERSDDALYTLQRGLEHVNAETSKSVVSDMYSIMGDIYYTKKSYKEAYAAYEASLKNNPDNIGALNNYAYYLSVNKGDLDKAEEMSYKTIKAEPDNSTYLDTYAWILFLKGRYTEARAYIDQAIKNSDDASGVVVEHCGDIYYMVGDTARAMEYWQRSLNEGNDSVTLKKKIKSKKYIAE
jgi:tetratricopeptide (TPR) repeat protein